MRAVERSDRRSTEHCAAACVRVSPGADPMRRRGVLRAEREPAASRRLPSLDPARGRRGGEQLPGGREGRPRLAAASSLEDCRRASELAVSRPRRVGVAGFDLLDAASSSVEVRRPPAPGGTAKEECLNAMAPMAEAAPALSVCRSARGRIRLRSRHRLHRLRPQSGGIGGGHADVQTAASILPLVAKSGKLPDSCFELRPRCAPAGGYTASSHPNPSKRGV